MLGGLKSGRIKTRMLESRIPSPFTHSLLLLGQYGEAGSIPTRERRSRLMHLHRELLRQILDEETLRNLLDREAVEEVDARLQRTEPQRKARNANELARILLELGDLVDVPDDELSLLDRADAGADKMLSELVSAHRAISVPLTTTETNRERWISTENFPLYRAAFGVEIAPDENDKKIIRALTRKGPCPIDKLPAVDERGERLERLVRGYQVLRLPGESTAEYVAAGAWLPKKIFGQKMPRDEARLALIEKFMRWHGPVTKYEVMERYGFADQIVDDALSALHEQRIIARGEYVPTKAIPQWCYKTNLEEIHRLTLNRLRKEMEPATPEEYVDFIVRWQHVHPGARLSGIDGLREVIEQCQGQDNFQALLERDVLPGRVEDYTPSMLDRLCYGGEVFWRRFAHNRFKRGQIGFCLRKDHNWIVPDPNEIEMNLKQWDQDIPDVCETVRQFLAENGACFFDDIVKGTQLDWRYVLRGIWHLVWTGEATNDSFESIRHAHITSGLSGCYDLFKNPRRDDETLDYIVRHMLENRKLDPRLGRWVPTERLLPGSFEPLDHDKAATAWARLLLKRHGIVCRDTLKREVCAPQWRDIRRALAKMELLGKVRRGFFVEDISGEQYATPEAVEALREAKLRHPNADGEGTSDVDGTDEPMVLLNVCDPACPFPDLFPLTNEAGQEIKRIKNPHNYVVVQAGQPLLIYRYQRNVDLLADLTQQRAEQAMRALQQIVDGPTRIGAYKRLVIHDWNGHPADVSPARHLLAKLGFARSTTSQRELIYDGTSRPGDDALAAAEREMPEVFERAGKEEAPVAYDAEWIISRSSPKMQPKVRETIEFLERILPKECELAYHPRSFVVLYRGVNFIYPRVKQKEISLGMGWAWWAPVVRIAPDTDLNSPDFISEANERFEEERRRIDSRLNPEPAE